MDPVVRPASEKAVPTYVYEKRRLIQILAVPRVPVEFHEGHLDLLVAVGAQALAFFLGAESLADVIRKPARHVQETLATGGAVMGNCRLDQVPRTVQRSEERRVGKECRSRW